MLATTEARPSRPRRVSRPLVWILWLGTSCASLMALAASLHWFAELFSHFRLHYLLAQALLCIVFLNTRRYPWLAATLLLAVPNLAYVGPYLTPLFHQASAASASDAGRDRWVVLNLNYRQRDADALLAWIKAKPPTLMIFSEYTPAWHQRLAGPLAGWPHRVLRPREDPFGMAVYSRLPLSEVEELALSELPGENLKLQVALDGRAVDLYAVHLFPPVSARLAAERNAQLDALAARLAEPTPRPRLVVGDLNLTPFSPWFRRFEATTGLTDSRRAQGIHVTWPTHVLPLWLPIDHCLSDAPDLVQQVNRGPDVGSDHYPLELLLAAAN